MEAKMVQVQAMRARTAQQVPVEERVLSNDAAETVYLLDQRASARASPNRLQKVTVLNVSPSRTTNTSKPSSDTALRDLHAQLQTLQVDLRAMLTSSSSSSSAPPAQAPAQRDAAFQASLDSAMQQFAETRDRILRNRHGSGVKEEAGDAATAVGWTRVTVPSVSVDAAKSGKTAIASQVRASSSRGAPLPNPFNTLRGLRPVAPSVQPSPPPPPEQDNPAGYYGSVARTLEDLARRKEKIVGQIRGAIAGVGDILAQEEEDEEEEGGGGAFRVMQDELRELGGFADERKGEIDEEDLEDLEEVARGTGTGTFLSELFNGERIERLVRAQIESANKEAVGGLKGSDKKVSLPPPTGSALQPSTKMKANLTTSSTASVLATSSKIPVRKRPASRTQPPLSSRMPGVSFTRAGIKPEKDIEKPKTTAMSQGGHESQVYKAPPSTIEIPPYSEHRKSRSPTRSPTRPPSGTVTEDPVLDEIRAEIHNYHVTALSSKFLKAGKVIQSNARPAALNEVPSREEVLPPPGSPKRKHDPRDASPAQSELASPARRPKIPEFYNVKVASAPVFLRRTTIRPPSLQFLEGSRPDWDQWSRDGRKSASPSKGESPKKASPSRLPPQIPIQSAEPSLSSTKPSLELVAASGWSFQAN
ncbi:hypothetical protein BC830DRAFT_303364 [Chytriomyces sp. MP71]|nr:hypothetical protein BC830DRAFT_303364 [Chytriomyces sp. MP71]